MSTSDAGHAPPEALSAFLDGEAPEWAAHLEGCARCRAEVSRLREVATAVARPVPPLPASLVDRAVARALGAAEPGSTAGAPGPAPGRPVVGRRRRSGATLVGLASGSIAAVLLAVLAAFAVFEGGDDKQVDTALAPPPEAAQDRATTGAAGGPVSGGDLGEVGDAGALAGRLRGRIPGTGGAPTAMAAAAEEAGRGSASSRAAPAMGPAAPCEAAARAAAPDLGPLVYVADGRSEGRPVVVLGFAGAGPVTLLVLTTDGCRPVFSTEVS